MDGQTPTDAGVLQSGKPLRVLIVEDSADDTLLLVRHLRRGGYSPEYRRVETAETMRAALAEATWDLVLSDHQMPHFSMPEALAVLNESGVDTPFIIVSGTIGEELAVQAMKNGADDFVPKGNLTRLVASIDRELADAVERRERRRAEKEVETQKRLLLLQGTALESAANGIVLTDRQGIITWANKAFTRLTGYTAEEAVGQNPRFLNSGKQDSVFYKHLWDTILAGNVWHGELINRRKDGNLYTEEMTITPVCANGDGITHFIAIKQDVTERKRIEAEKTRLAAILEATPDFVGTTSVGERGLYLNQGGRDLLGIGASDDVSGLCIADVHPPWAYQRIKDEGIPEAVRNGYWRGEAALRSRDGHEIPVLIAMVAHRSLAGKIEYVSIVAHDISMRKQAELALRNSEERYRRITDNMLEAITQLDVNGIIQYASPSNLSVAGYRPEELVGTYAFDNVHPDDRAETVAIFAEALRTGKGTRMELRFRHADGRYLHLELFGNVIHDSEGHPCGAVVASRDITERKRAEEQLRLQSVALTSAANAIFITDAAGCIEWANDSFCRLSGFARPEIIGQNPRILKSGVHPPAFYDRLWRAISAGDVWNGEVTERNRDGSEYVVQETITPLRNAADKITHYVAVQEDITARKRAEERIHHLAFHDILTDLPNRTVFQTSLPLAIAQASRKKNMLSVMLLDLDHFKLVNDSLGHLMGDALLKVTAERLRAAVRSTDIVARLGGDEFAVIQTDLTHVGGAIVLARKLLDLLAAPIEIEGRRLHTTASLGVALYPTDDTNIEALVRNADMALYRAKREGRNRFQFFSAEMDAEVQRRVGLESELRQALELKQFVLFFQPQFTTNGGIAGMEALIRWDHPQHGLTSPSEFIGVAEDSGLIVELGRWILKDACARAIGWQHTGLPCKVAVNLSAAQFKQGDVVEMVTAALGESGLDPRRLELEVTESLLMENLGSIADSLQRLRQMGVKLAIDDFGTGYSSLAYLRRFPVDSLKIDQSFVKDIPTSSDAGAIVRAIITLGHSLGLRVIAEGVETKEQLAFLSQEGCDQFQGFLLGRPKRSQDVSEWLSSSGDARDKMGLQPVLAASVPN